MRDVAVARARGLCSPPATPAGGRRDRSERAGAATSRSRTRVRSSSSAATAVLQQSVGETLQVIGAFEETPEDGAHDGDVHRWAHAEVVGFAVRKLVRVLG